MYLNISKKFSLAFGSLIAQSNELLPPSDQSFWQTLITIGILSLFFYNLAL